MTLVSKRVARARKIRAARVAAISRDECVAIVRANAPGATEEDTQDAADALLRFRQAFAATPTRSDLGLP